MTVHVFIRGDLPDLGSEFSTAPCMATYRVIRQESAEAIVGARKQARQTGKDLPRRRAEHREGKNLYELS